MSDRTKDIILKTLMVSELVFGGIMCFVLPIISCFYYYDILNDLYFVSLYLVLFTGVLFMILLPIFGMKSKPQKADRFPLPYVSYEELMEYLSAAIESHDYQGYDTISIDEKSEMMMFINPKFWEMDCIAVIRVPELSDAYLELAENKITEFMTDYYGKKRITDTINMTILFCVDRITPAFQKLLNGILQQEFKNRRLVAGFSLGGRTLYVAKLKDGYGTSIYKKMRKKLLHIFDIK